MDKKPIFNKTIDHDILISFIQISVITTLITASTLVPIPGVLDISLDYYRNKMIFGEIIFQIEHFTLMVIPVLFLIRIFKRKEVLLSAFSLFLSLLWLFTKCILYSKSPTIMESTDSYILPPLFDSKIFTIIRLQLLNSTFFPFYFLITKLLHKKHNKESVLQGILLTLIISLVVWFSIFLILQTGFDFSLILQKIEYSLSVYFTLSFIAIILLFINCRKKVYE